MLSLVPPARRAIAIQAGEYAERAIACKAESAQRKSFFPGNAKRGRLLRIAASNRIVWNSRFVRLLPSDGHGTPAGASVEPR